MNRQELDEAILEVKEEIHELGGLVWASWWEVLDSGYTNRGDVWDERLSKLERLDELYEMQDQKRVQVSRS